jgi:hypothetical protein
VVITGRVVGISQERMRSLNAVTSRNVAAMPVSGLLRSALKQTTACPPIGGHYEACLLDFSFTVAVLQHFLALTRFTLAGMDRRTKRSRFPSLREPTPRSARRSRRRVLRIASSQGQTDHCDSQRAAHLPRRVVHRGGDPLLFVGDRASDYRSRWCHTDSDSSGWNQRRTSDLKLKSNPYMRTKPTAISSVPVAHRIRIPERGRRAILTDRYHWGIPATRSRSGLPAQKMAKPRIASEIPSKVKVATTTC